MELNWSALTEPSFLIPLIIAIAVYIFFSYWEKKYKKELHQRILEKKPRNSYETRKAIEYYTKEIQKNNKQ